MKTVSSMSVVSFGEIWHGIERMSDGRRRERLLNWLSEALPERFEGRILDVDRRIAETWGVIMARTQKAGAPMGAMDAFFAATAQTRGLTLVTRNVRDFSQAGISLLNPWTTQR